MIIAPIVVVEKGESSVVDDCPWLKMSMNGHVTSARNARVTSEPYYVIISGDFDSEFQLTSATIIAISFWTSLGFSLIRLAVDLAGQLAVHWAARRQVAALYRRFKSPKTGARIQQQFAAAL